MTGLDRRRFIAGAAASLAVVPTRSAASDLATFRRRYRDLIVIDGNLVPPFDPDTPLDAATADQIRSSGLTALKLTIGGSGGTLAGTTADVADIMRGIARNPMLFMVIASADDFLVAKRTGRIGIIPSFEAAGMLEGKVDNIDHFAALGVKVMGLSYNLATPFASGALSPQPSPGLTGLGRAAVERMNALGVTLDLSHSDEPSTLGAVTASRAPVLITHAGCAAVHLHPRNKSDRVLRAIAGSGGVIGIFELSFIARAPGQPSLDDYMAHLTHALDVAGEDHVGIGSDTFLLPFDTSPASLADWDKSIAERKVAGVSAPGEGPPPFVTGLNRPDRSVVIGEELLRRGYSRRVAEKVLGTNFQRAFTATWQS